jgi:hypothetical protein
MAFLRKEDVLLKLAPFGVKSMATVRYLIKKEGLPAKYLTPKKIFFVDTEVESWMATRSLGLRYTASTAPKATKVIRKKRKGGTAATTGFMAEVVPLKSVEA